MELNFVETNGLYVATVGNKGVTDSFNLHLESSRAGVAEVYMRTSGNAYAKCNDHVDIVESDTDGTYCGEVDVFGIVFGKDVKIVSNVPVSTGVLTLKP